MDSIKQFISAILCAGFILFVMFTQEHKRDVPSCYKGGMGEDGPVIYNRFKNNVTIQCKAVNDMKIPKTWHDVSGMKRHFIGIIQDRDEKLVASKWWRPSKQRWEYVLEKDYIVNLNITLRENSLK